MIDKPTIARIMDSTKIEEVVSEFVTLKKRGINYVGLCPFHNDSHPSFSVSPTRGICHCFTCGKGGNAINFLMELEQMTYPEALRWLANKYHIEIQEREMTNEEKLRESERESIHLQQNCRQKAFIINVLPYDTIKINQNESKKLICCRALAFMHGSQHRLCAVAVS